MIFKTEVQQYNSDIYTEQHRLFSAKCIKLTYKHTVFWPTTKTNKLTAIWLYCTRGQNVAHGQSTVPKKIYVLADVKTQT